MCDFFINNPSNEIQKSITTDILSGSESIKFHSTLPSYSKTPLINLPQLAQRYKVQNIWVKDESYRFGLNAFKSLGASYAVKEITRDNRHINTLCTATDGNHGRAVAWAARMSGIKSVVFVPSDTTNNRIVNIATEGATVIKTEGNYDEACRVAEQVSLERGWKLIQDTSWHGYEDIPAQIMAGYLTTFIELEDSLHPVNKPEIDTVFLQAGVGSFAATAIWYYINRYGTKRPKLVIVEPLEADGILASFKAGKRSSSKGNYNTIMAGLNCGLPSASGWEIISNGADISIRISDEYTRRAMIELYKNRDSRIVAGESGAAGLAGFIALLSLDNMEQVKEALAISEKSNILFINTEGATDVELFNEIIK